MINEEIEQLSGKMTKCVEKLHQDLLKIRSGRATPDLLDHLKVESYGTLTPINQVASIHTEGSRMLVITPWDKSIMIAIEKCIRTSSLSLNPASHGDFIRVALPELTEERRKEYIKVTKEFAEKARVAVRIVRRNTLNEIKRLCKDKVVTTDDEHRAEDQANKLTEKAIASIDHALELKEKELLAV